MSDVICLTSHAHDPKILFPKIFSLSFATLVTSFLLFAVGAASSLMTGRNWFFAGARMVLFGMAAAAVTFGISGLIGISV